MVFLRKNSRVHEVSYPEEWSVMPRSGIIINTNNNKIRKLQKIIDTERNSI